MVDLVFVRMTIMLELLSLFVFLVVKDFLEEEEGFDG
jgi:hypothetical protein